ncbi:hypothetical protein OG394_32120 [Kribbella sp. NBC_01245]|uniref:hypothetical protein n=1 Tax=Kribbella sp. NBC_01245 TaxID=2903578 RepID=UPI002E2AF17B|nr:hypothetical protein [Kribbella sp. NBC_01245]
MADLSHPLGPEVPPGHPAHEWVQRIVHAVAQRTGRPTSWNGRLYEEPSYAAMATARPDHSLAGGVDDVIRPLQNAATAGRYEAFPLRAAVAAVAHEAIHLSSEYGDGASDAEVGEVALDEGLTEAWTLANVDGVLTDIGMDRQVPSIVSQHTVDSYPTYTAATNELTRGLSEASGMPPDQVRDHLLNTPRSERWNAAADLVIDGQLGGQLHPEDRAELRKHLVPEMRGGFEKLPAVQWGYDLDTEKAAQGQQIGQQAIEGLKATTGRLQAQYTQSPGQPLSPAPDRPPVYVTENSGRLEAPPPLPVSTEPKRSMQELMAAQREKAKAPLNVLDGQAPASGAVSKPAAPQAAPNAVRPTGPQQDKGGRSVD